jgi:hypothetical protein
MHGSVLSVVLVSFVIAIELIGYSPVTSNVTDDSKMIVLSSPDQLRRKADKLLEISNN